MAAPQNGKVGKCRDFCSLSPCMVDNIYQLSWHLSQKHTR